MGMKEMDETAAPTILEQILSRINSAAYNIGEIANKLNEHADKLHGTMPEPKPDTDTIQRAPDGMIDRIFEGLDHLDQQFSRNAMAAGRNSNLA